MQCGRLPGAVAAKGGEQLLAVCRSDLLAEAADLGSHVLDAPHPQIGGLQRADLQRDMTGHGESALLGRLEDGQEHLARQLEVDLDEIDAAIGEGGNGLACRLRRLHRDARARVELGRVQPGPRRDDPRIRGRMKRSAGTDRPDDLEGPAHVPDAGDTVGDEQPEEAIAHERLPEDMGVDREPSPDIVTHGVVRNGDLFQRRHTNDAF